MKGRKLFGDRTTLPAQALYLGRHLDVRAAEQAPHLATAPLTLAAGRDGCAVLFRYGAVVLYGLDPMEGSAFLASLRPLVRQPVEEPEHETVEINIAADKPERVEADETITLHAAAIERLQTVADILAKSVALTHFETQVAHVFERIEPMAAALRSTGRIGSGSSDLVREIGDALLMQHQMVGRVEVTEKPELVWDLPDLDRLYARLQEQYELPDRHRALDKKLEVIDRTARTALDLLQTKRSLRLEWYIVILILIEIVILLYDLFLRRS